MNKNFPRPTGRLQGDDRPMPDRGTGSGLNGDTYGADVSQSATNTHGKMGGATRSHAPESCAGSNNKMGH